jgi:DNA-binding transcriptional LysR family regulator
MELRDLEYFVAVAETSSFSQAARELHVVQSGVSATIRRLETELGAQLFDRAVHPVSLTGAGTILLPGARETLDAARRAKEAVASTPAGVVGLLTIGMMRSTTFVDLPLIFHRLATVHPGIEIRLRASAGGSSGLVEQILNRELDAAFLSYPGPAPAGLNLREISQIQLKLVVNPDHRLASKRSVQVDQLTEEKFIDSPAGYGNRILVDNAFASKHLSRRVALEIPDIGTASEFIRQGIGVGFLSDDLVPDDLVAIPLSDADLIWKLSFATPSGRPLSQPVRAFSSVLEDALTVTRTKL